ncbi:MAG: S-layer homology domain-containing protein [Acutalibacter sp.]|nr:S-layer homology domain-containing protein [Acutalibacter sp.]
MKAYSLLLAIAVVCTVGLLPAEKASAAETPTSLGLAEHGIKAHRDGWVYLYAGKGQAVGNTRGSDCAGLLYAYFSDVGAIGKCQGGASGQVTYNCVFSNDISEGIPNIHGLALTMPDYVSPGSGLYGHIGIYIGNNEATDNSDAQFNMRRETVVGNTGRNWNAWHVFDNGMMYPADGWYQLDGKLVHYTNYEYDANTVIDGYLLGSDGYAVDSDGKPVPVSAVTLSTKYVSASQVAAYLRTRYSGKDSTYELIYGNGGPSSDYNGRITGSGVRLRSEPNTTSAIVSTLAKGANVNILEEVTGEKVTADGVSTDKWYSVTTVSGLKGYVCSLYAERVSVSPAGDPPAAPTISASDGYVVITSSDGADIYYTTDGSVPTENSTPYTQPLYLTGYTFRAIAVANGMSSPVSTATVLSNSSVFTDFVRTDWFYQAVDLAVSYGIFRGNGDGTLSPNGKITRAQFVVALAGLDGADLTAYQNGTSFSDLEKLPEKMRPAVAWAYEKGYVSGFGDNTFRPNDSISREQMCVILRKYAGLERNSSSSLFADDSRVSSWAKDAVYACRDFGLISGMGDNLFDPLGTATRAQACVIMTKLYKR